MKKIFITGICGMLGHSLANKLTEKNKVSGCDLVIPKKKIKNVKYYNFDLTDFEYLEEKLLELKPDFIINTAAIINVDYCEKNEDLAFIINSEIPKKITQIADKINGKVIQISTDAVFDGNKENSYCEEDETNPINIYGLSKRNGEINVLNGIGPHIVLRTNIFGWSLNEKLSFAEWIYSSLLKNEEIYMFTDIYYSPIYIGDFSDLIDIIIDIDELKGLFHLAGSKYCSKYDFAEYFAEIFNFPLELVIRSKYDDSKLIAPRSKNMKMNSKKLENIIECKIPDFKKGINNLFKELKYYENDKYWK